MSAGDPFDRVTEAWAGAGERLGEYAAVWQQAIERNATESYVADDFLVDLQTLWGMGIRDVVKVGASLVEIAAGLLPETPGGSAEDPGASAG